MNHQRNQFRVSFVDIDQMMCLLTATVRSVAHARCSHSNIILTDSYKAISFYTSLCQILLSLRSSTQSVIRIQFSLLITPDSVLSTHYWALNTPYTILSTQNSVTRTQCSVTGTHYTVLSTQDLVLLYSSLSTQYSVHSTHDSVLSTQYSVLNSQYLVRSQASPD